MGRGAGETLACGTGACAVLVTSVLNGISERKATVKLLGGDLIVSGMKIIITYIKQGLL